MKQKGEIHYDKTVGRTALKVYNHRTDSDYLEHLSSCLDIDGPNGLLKASVPIDDPRQTGKRIYDRCCRLDFVGIAASNLFYVGDDSRRRGVAKKMRDLFARSDELNKEGIFVKMRFLLVYPYSAHALSRIQAEVTENRSTMSSRRYVRDVNLVDEVDEQMFFGSAFVTKQGNMLRQLQRLIDHYGWSPTGVNQVAVRFVPLSPNLCMLILNNKVFTDSYLLAKESLDAPACANKAPLVEIIQSQSPDAFSAYEDHFRYLWDLDLTLFCEDATHYEPGSSGTLGKLKPIAQVDFEQKASVIEKRNPKHTDQELGNWKFRAAQQLSKITIEPTLGPGSESLFITCAWDTKEDGTPAPNVYAERLRYMLEKDFSNALPAVILKAPVATYLTQQLYQSLDRTTLSVVLLTPSIKDEDGKVYCRPNIYHELGYLMRQLGSRRVFIAKSSQVAIPSNIQDSIRGSMPNDKVELMYADLLEWLGRVSWLSPGTVAKAIERHTRRIDRMIVRGDLSSTEGTEAKARLAEIQEALS